jgi:hypothetical protein
MPYEYVNNHVLYHLYDPSTTAFVIRNFSETIKSVAIADGQNVSHAAKYVNNALFNTPLEDIYGGNLERLRKIREGFDLDDVMGLAGGWRNLGLNCTSIDIPCKTKNQDQNVVRIFVDHC